MAFASSVAHACIGPLASLAVYALVAWLLTRIARLVFNRSVTKSRRDFS